MNRTKLTAGSLLAIVLAMGITARAADAPVHYQAQAGASQVLLRGTSTLHDWEMKGVILGGSLDFATAPNFDPSQTALAGLTDGKLAVTGQAIIPVRSIKSEAETRPEYMERLMQEAMKESQFSKITFRVADLKLKEPRAAGAPFAFEASGELAIAGVTNKIEFPVTISSPGADQIKVSGEAAVKMTDYGVTPPAPNFGLGLMKCGDEVKIIFDWVLAKKQPAP